MRRLCKHCFGEINERGLSVHGGEDINSRLLEAVAKAREVGSLSADPLLPDGENITPSGVDASRMSPERRGEVDRMLTFEQFSAINRQRCESVDGFNHALGSWSLSDWFLAVLGEFGESANVGKKLNRVRDGIPGNKESPEELRAKLKKEIGDTFVYLDLLAQAQGFTVADAAVEVFNAKSDEIGCSIKIDLQGTTAAASSGQQEEEKHATRVDGNG